MRAWIQVRAAKVNDRVIAVVADYGEDAFHTYSRTLGAPASRYYAKGGHEFSRQWNVRRRANNRLFWALWRVLRVKNEGEVVEVKFEARRVKAVAA